MTQVIVNQANQSSESKTRKKSLKRNIFILVVILIALGLRIWAAWQLPGDYDEPVYLGNAYDYAELIHQGDWQGVIDYAKVSEHPPLTKLLYAVILLASENGLNWEQALFSTRLVSAVFGTLGVALVTLIDPLAGLLLAVQTLAVKYTGQAYLEATAMFAMLLSWYALLRSKKLGDRWFWLSAAALGMTAASKYSYFPIVCVIFYLIWWEKRYRSPLLLGFVGVAVITFFALDPYLWNQPIQRLLDSMLFHQQYSQGAHVQEVGYPWFQPVLWISLSRGYLWHPEVFFYMGIDGPIFLASLYGAYVAWHKARWVVVWLVTGMLFLLLWPTKWPQYTLVVLPAFCLAASSALGNIFTWLKEQEAYWEWFGNMFPRPSRRYFVTGGIVLGIFVLLIAINTAILTIHRLPWSKLNTSNSALPSDIVNDLLALPDGRMLVATEAGAAFWQAAGEDELKDIWQIITPADSDLPNQRVLTLLQTPDGVLWFGTASGLGRFDGQNWQVFHSTELGLPNEQVNDLAYSSYRSQSRLWVATQSGVAIYDGQTWTTITTANSGLIDDAVFTIAVQSVPQGELVWFGSLSGVVSYDLRTGEWHAATADEVSMGWGGVSDLLVDSSGRLWVSTLGGGISLYDGQNWSYIRQSNSDLPYSMVQDVEEFEAGVFWIASSLPNEAGGVVSCLEGEDWQVYKPLFSGYSGAETVTIDRDAFGRIWFGTRTAGIYLFEEKK